MNPPDALSTEASELAEQIAELADRAGMTVAVAESLTGGKIACHLAAAPSSSSWFRGGVVAYASEVKHDLLGVPPGPVVSERCARQMATGAARLLGADVAVAVTGVGGPDPQDGEPPGTVCFGLTGDAAQTQRFDGAPQEVLDRTTLHALLLLRDAVQERTRS